MARAKQTDRQVAEAEGVSRSTVCRRRQAAGVEPAASKFTQPAHRDWSEILDQLGEHHRFTVAELAERHGCTRRAVQRALARRELRGLARSKGE